MNQSLDFLRQKLSKHQKKALVLQLGLKLWGLMNQKLKKEAWVSFINFERDFYFSKTLSFFKTYMCFKKEKIARQIIKLINLELRIILAIEINAKETNK